MAVEKKITDKLVEECSKNIDGNEMLYNVFFYSSIIFLLLVQHGDIEINPRPKRKQPKYFSCCNWNINSLLADNKI